MKITKDFIRAILHLNGVGKKDVETIDGLRECVVEYVYDSINLHIRKDGGLTRYEK